MVCCMCSTIIYKFLNCTFLSSQCSLAPKAAINTATDAKLSTQSDRKITTSSGTSRSCTILNVSYAYILLYSQHFKYYSQYFNEQHISLSKHITLHNQISKLSQVVKVIIVFIILAINVIADNPQSHQQRKVNFRQSNPESGSDSKHTQLD